MACFLRPGDQRAKNGSQAPRRIEGLALAKTRSRPAVIGNGRRMTSLARLIVERLAVVNTVVVIAFRHGLQIDDDISAIVMPQNTLESFIAELGVSWLNETVCAGEVSIGGESLRFLVLGTPLAASLTLMVQRAPSPEAEPGA